MILDNENLLSDDQAVTVTAASTNYIDLGALGTPVKGNTLVKDIGKGNLLPLLIQATETFTAAGAATLTIDLEVDDNTGFSSATTVWSSGAIAVADLSAGWKANLNYVPQGTNERYARLNYTVATGPMTAGKLTAGITGGDDSNNNYN